MKRAIVVGLVAGASALQFATPGDAMPAAFQLVYDGHHVFASFPTPTGLAHVGRFTTNYAACLSGTADDTAQTDQVATRLFTCDGSGATFTATVGPHLAEHGGTGAWQITSGTGALADLRGRGSFASVLTSGDPNNFTTIAFRSTWSGFVDLDAAAPTLTLTKHTTTKLKRPRTYRLNLAVALSESGGGPVSYTLVILDPATLDTYARKSGSTNASSLDWTFVVKASRGLRALRLQVRANDEVGNETTLRRTIALER